MTGQREPQDPLARKALKLRKRAGALKGQAESLLKKADDLRAEAERIEAAQPTKLPKREDFSQAAVRIVREATERD